MKGSLHIHIIYILHEFNMLVSTVMRCTKDDSWDGAMCHYKHPLHSDKRHERSTW